MVPAVLSQQSRSGWIPLVDEISAAAESSAVPHAMRLHARCIMEIWLASPLLACLAGYTSLLVSSLGVIGARLVYPGDPEYESLVDEGSEDEGVSVRPPLRPPAARL